MTTTDLLGDWETQLANCRDYWLGWAAEERIDDDLTIYRSGVADWQLNGVLRVTRGVVDDALAEARKRLAGVPAMWLAGPDSAPGVYLVTTPEDQRRKGIGTALTDAALRVARERGLPVACLQATPPGLPVYQRMGFHTVAETRIFAL